MGDTIRLKDRLDICETLYGKMEHVIGVFYRSIDKCHFVNITTGEDLLADSRFNMSKYKYNQGIRKETLRILKVCKHGIIWSASELATDARQDVFYIFGLDGEVKVKIAKEILPTNVKEYKTKEGVIYLVRGKYRTNSPFVVIMNNDFSLKEIKFKIERLYVGQESIDLILLENGKLIKETYDR